METMNMRAEHDSPNKSRL